MIVSIQTQTIVSIQTQMIVSIQTQTIVSIQTQTIVSIQTQTIVSIHGLQWYPTTNTKQNFNRYVFNAALYQKNKQNQCIMFSSKINIQPIFIREWEMFYLTMHSTHFIYGYMASDIWLRTILIVRKETRCRHIGYSYRLTARVLLYAPSHRQDNTYHGLCYTSRGALAGTRNNSMGPPHEGSIRRPNAPWANTLPLSYVPLPP